MTALWSTQEQKWQWWTNWDNWLWWFSDATLYRRITSQFPLVEVGNRSCTQIPFQGIGWRCRWPPLRMFRRSSQHQQHCRQVFPRYAWQHLFFLHPPTLQELISSRPDRRTIQEKPTHHPSKTYKDTQDTLLDSTFLRSFLSLQLYPCFAAHMWITHTMVVRLGISEVAVCYL